MRVFLWVMLFGAFLTGCKTNESPEGQVDDLQIVAQVKSKLAEEVGPTTVTNISVDSTNGVVTLAGQVDSNAVRTKAEAVSRGIPRVVRVIDNLQIAAKPPAQGGPAGPG